jgi:phosphate transport system regulatory protein PhoU
MPTIPVHADASAIRANAVQMGDLARQAIVDSVKSLNDRDTDLARKVLEGDVEIDRFESAIDRMCLDVMAENLHGKQLRTVAATYRFIVDLERIGDYSVSIANVTLAVANKPITGLELHIARMADIATRMLRRSMEAYATESGAGLEGVFSDDLEIDRLYGKVFYDGLGEIVHEPETATNVIYIIVASRALERIGDHITDIAERVEYIETGRLVARSVPMHVPPGMGDASW